MLRIQKYPETFERGLSINNKKLRWVASVFFPRVPELCIFCSAIDLFTDTAAILNSIVLTEKLWAAEGAMAGKFIVYTAFRINFYCLSLIFHNKYYKRYIFPSRYLAVVPMVIEKLLLKVITPQYSF